MDSKERDFVALASKRVLEEAGRRSMREVYERRISHSSLRIGGNSI